MIPKFFGDADRQLFGVYHPPLAAPRSAGVVLCYPGPQEYRQAHWVYRRLAGMLAREGWHALRFDYYATGDSAGESADGSLAQWTADVATAVGELRDVAGVQRVALVGMRLGAALALRATAAGARVSDLVLWDPVVSGAAYLAQLEAMAAREAGERRYPADDRLDPDELLGCPMPPAMRADFVALDLLGEPLGMPARALVVGGEARPEYDALAARFRGEGVACAHHVVPDHTLARADVIVDTLLAQRVPQAIVDALTGGKAA